VKLTFAKGASLKDPAKLFNSSLDGNTRRAIDIHEGDAGAFKALVLAAVALNASVVKAKPRRANAKEAFYKAVYPTAQRVIDFTEVEVVYWGWAPTESVQGIRGTSLHRASANAACSVGPRFV